MGKPGPTPCKYHQVCNLSASAPHGDDAFCILHLPEPRKDYSTFQDGLKAHLSAGSCNLRYVFWPDALQNPDLSRRQFPLEADFRDTAFRGQLNLSECSFHGSLYLGGPSFKNVLLNKATVRGTVSAEHAIGNTLDMNEAVFDGPVNVDLAAGAHVRAWGATFRDTVSVRAASLPSLNLQFAEFHAGLTLRGRSGDERNFIRTKFCGSLDWSDCEFLGSLSLELADLEAVETLKLNGTVIRGDLLLRGRGLLPAEIDLSNTTTQGKVRVEGELGGRTPDIVAGRERPRFGDEVWFTNVNLSNCLLVGNVIQRIEFSDVQWHRGPGRWMLYDEVIYRKDKEIRERIPAGRIREAYQVLKEKYKKVGDHVRSGDFHYGEMEMKRRELSWPRRVLSPEFLYWLASGYGTRGLRALVVLGCLIGVFGAIFYATDRASFDGSFWKSLWFSLATATLQRPPLPVGISELGRWFYLIEALLGPAQIALFVLALRMRLRR